MYKMLNKDNKFFLPLALLVHQFLLWSEYSFHNSLPIINFGQKSWPLYFFILDGITIGLFSLALVQFFKQKIRSKLYWFVVALLFLYPLLGIWATYSDLTANYPLLEQNTNEAELVRLNPKKTYENWNTVSTYDYAFQYPDGWEFDNVTFKKTSKNRTGNYCPAYEGEIIGHVYEEPVMRNFSKDEFYDLSSKYWGGTAKYNYNGGVGEVNQHIIYIDNVKVIEKRTLWLEGHECAYKDKPRIDIEYYVYLDKKDKTGPKQIRMEIRYFPSDKGHHEIVEKIISTLNFAEY